VNVTINDFQVDSNLLKPKEGIQHLVIL